MDIHDYIKILHLCLSKDLLKKQYQQNHEEHHFTTGHCYIASEAVFHTFGGKDKWSAWTGRDHNNGTHWWLKNKETGEIIDPTSQQYTSIGLTPPYQNGRPCAFLTKLPSARAQKLMLKIEEKINEISEITQTVKEKQNLITNKKIEKF